MDLFIEQITSKTAYIVIAIIIGSVLIFAIVQRILKLALFAVGLIIVYICYLQITGQEVPKTKNEIIEHSNKKIEILKKKGEKLLSE